MMAKEDFVVQIGRVFVLGHKALCLELLDRHLRTSSEKKDIPVSVTHGGVKSSKRIILEMQCCSCRSCKGGIYCTNRKSWEAVWSLLPLSTYLGRFIANMYTLMYSCITSGKAVCFIDKKAVNPGMYLYIHR